MKLSMALRRVSLTRYVMNVAAEAGHYEHSNKSTDRWNSVPPVGH